MSKEMWCQRTWTRPLQPSRPSEPSSSWIGAPLASSVASTISHLLWSSVCCRWLLYFPNQTCNIWNICREPFSLVAGLRHGFSVLPGTFTNFCGLKPTASWITSPQKSVEFWICPNLGSNRRFCEIILKKYGYQKTFPEDWWPVKRYILPLFHGIPLRNPTPSPPFRGYFATLEPSKSPIQGGSWRRFGQGHARLLHDFQLHCLFGWGLEVGCFRRNLGKRGFSLNVFFFK